MQDTPAETADAPSGATDRPKRTPAPGDDVHPLDGCQPPKRRLYAACRVRSS